MFFEELYKQSPSLKRHNGAPNFNERVQYLSHIRELGYKKTCLRFRAAALVVIAEDTDLLSRKAVSREEVSRQVWRSINNKQRGIENKQDRYEHVYSIANLCLTYLEKLELLSPKAKAVQSELPVHSAYFNFLKNEIGSPKATIKNRNWILTDFLYWLIEQSIKLEDLHIEDIDRYFQAKPNWGRVTIANVAAGLRGFLSFCETNSLCPPNLAGAIQGPRIYRFENVPFGPSWKAVQKILKAPDLRKNIGIRDRAMLLLLSVYGLRSIEVVSLKLEDIDWSKETIAVYRSKNRRHQLFPLTKEVGEAIAAYLKKGRPQKVTSREIFLTHKIPISPLKPATLSYMTKRNFVAAGVHPAQGAHSLRHACASNLMSQQVSLKEIGDHLGHCSMDATRIYAKVDLPGLRQVSEFDLGGLL